MNWFLIALLPPLLWSITNHIDKYVLSKLFKDNSIGNAIIFSSGISLLVLPVIFFISPSVLKDFHYNYLLISINGFIYLLATLPYFYALKKDDASLTIPLFQMIPVFSFILEYLLFKETLNGYQIIGGLLIIISSIFISLDISQIKKLKMKWDIFILMTISSLLYAFNFLLFKYFAVETDFLTTCFWEYVGFLIFGICIFVFVRSYRNGFMKIIKNNKPSVFRLNGISEAINIIAKITFNYASTLIPVTLVWLVDGLQSVFVFIIGILLTIFLPKISKEDISKRTFFQRALAICIMMIGIYIINR